MTNFFFYDWRGVQDWGTAYYQSGYHPGHLPRPGGMSKQSKQDKHDWRVFSRGVAWAQAEQRYLKEQRDEDNALDGLGL